ncbi:hypothetical protein TruAng_008996 [Truncatella angustata]|nr:hypothetical protein TruAng_008996 [Truncatella angustata]
MPKPHDNLTNDFYMRPRERFWSWELMGDITVEMDGHAYTYALPLGTLITDLSKSIVETQGYVSLKRVFLPTTDCKGSSLGTTPNLVKWCDHAINNLQRNDALTYGTDFCLV